MKLDVKNIAKGIAGLAVLVIIGMVVWGWLGQYRQAGTEGAVANTTSTAEPTATAGSGQTASPTPSPAAKTIVILIEGLNMRKEPSADSARIRGLKKGDRVTLIKTEGSWHQVKDDAGNVGWISANPQYSKVEGK